MDYDDLLPGEVWESRCDPRDGEEASSPPPAPTLASLTDEELATLAPWF